MRSVPLSELVLHVDRLPVGGVITQPCVSQRDVLHVPTHESAALAAVSFDCSPAADRTDEPGRQFVPSWVEMPRIGLVLLRDHLARYRARHGSGSEVGVSAFKATRLQRERQGALDVRSRCWTVDHVVIAPIHCFSIRAHDHQSPLVTAYGFSARQAPGLLHVKVNDSRTDLVYCIGVQLQYLKKQLMVNRICGDGLTDVIRAQDLITYVVLSLRAGPEDARRHDERDGHATPYGSDGGLPGYFRTRAPRLRVGRELDAMRAARTGGSMFARARE
ncbi:hypothetical protein EDD26_0090 [Agrococcus jenensis]|uniref:Uncharacterized protein n=1 Tax=Agrococcus jenensis TaxID=46353 RepID=A0A3N2ANY8_9MICO|nr:hypothetical protein EDD26_0090 [Agrococcus jenensis]